MDTSIISHFTDDNTEALEAYVTQIPQLLSGRNRIQKLPSQQGDQPCIPVYL